MPINYEKQTYVNGSGATPLSAGRLNHNENGTKAAADAVDALGVTVGDITQELDGRLSEAALSTTIGDAIASDTGLTQRVDQAVTDADIPGQVQSEVAGLDVATSDAFDPELEQDEAFLGDEDGTPSKVGFDRDGEIAEATMRSAAGKGMARAVAADGAEIVVGDEDGTPSWLQANAAGLPTAAAKWAIANALRTYTGPDQPFAYPGNFILWTVTDSNGDVIDVRKVDNR